LTSIYAYPPTVDFEVLLVDNASTDDTVQQVQAQFSQVRLLTNSQNIGFARANNQAIRQCKGEYILLLNPDTEVMENSLERLVRFLDAHRQAGAAGSRLLNPDGTLQTSCYPMPTLFREFWRMFHLDVLRPIGIYNMATWDTETTRQVDVIQGASLLVRRKAFDRIGVLDETYFIYTEEVDLCYRLQKDGWQLHWVPQSKVIHYGGQSTKQIAENMFLRLYESKVLFMRKHYGWWGSSVYKMILFAATVARLIVSPLAWLQSQNQRQANFTLAGYYWQLIKALPGL
jgi:GT2 family glycosyltransferase